MQNHPARLFKSAILAFAVLASGFANAVTPAEFHSIANEFKARIKPTYDRQGEKLHKISLSIKAQDGIFDSFFVAGTDERADMPSIRERVIYFELTKPALSSLTRVPLLFILCHEAGHNLGGYPFSRGAVWDGTPYGSVEGQADYWSAKTCHKILSSEFLLPRDPEANAAITMKCEKSATSSNTTQDITQCRKSLWGYYRTLKYLGDLDPEDRDSVTDFSGFEYHMNISPADYEGKILDGPHPTQECRIQTLIAGSLNQPRPKCWFNPDYKYPKK